ncbi:hypothetical protein FACS1894188_07090 [Clostridia bacterium]|nr:hypothetical protein FACS1894188_07090 [Clostridia bacterium]
MVKLYNLDVEIPSRYKVISQNSRYFSANIDELDIDESDISIMETIDRDWNSCDSCSRVERWAEDLAQLIKQCHIVDRSDASYEVA